MVAMEIAAYNYLRGLHELGIPLFCVGTNSKDGEWPHGYTDFLAKDNGARMVRRQPTDAVAGVMGVPLAVVDVDPRNGGDIAEVRQELHDCRAPLVGEVLSGGLGRHFLVHVSKPLKSGKIGQGVDLLASRKACYLPGGHPRPQHEGRTYRLRWTALHSVVGQPDDVQFREWVAARRPTERARAARPDSEPLHQYAGQGRPWTPQRAAYVAGAVRIVERQISTSVQGTRNRDIHRATYSLAGLIASYDTPLAVQADAQRRLIAAARSVGHRSAEVTRAWDVGTRDPRSPMDAP